MKGKRVEFKGTVSRKIYSAPDFKVYAMNVDIYKYQDVKTSKYNDVSICGDISDLIVGAEYDVTATEEHNKYGVSYRVVNIKHGGITSQEDVRTFLYEILTKNQADVLLENYPNIIDLVKNNEDDKVDLNKLRGIKEATFEKIKQKIIENFKLAELVSEFKNVVSLNMIKRIYEIYPDINVLRKKLKSNPYTTLTRISRVGFKTADAIVIQLQDEKVVDFGYDVRTSFDRCLACAMYMLQENEEEGNTKMNLADLRRMCIDLVPACADMFADVIKDEDIYYNKETMDVGLARTYNAECKIAQTIVEAIKSEGDVWDIDIEQYRNAGEFELSDEQMKALDNMCKNNVCILNGWGGSGKSFSTKSLINMLDDNHKSYKIVAPTGKASKVIAEFTGRKASTIHRGLGYNPSGVWMYNKDYKIEEDVVIVDEFSMVDVWLFLRLVEAIDFSRTKLLMIGDNAQLCSVGCGNLLHDFMQAGIIPTVTLTKIFRYGDGGLAKVASDVRCGKNYLDKSMKDKVTTFGINKDYVFIDMPSEKISSQAVALYKKLLDNGNTTEKVHVLTAKNVGECGAIELNNMIQKVSNKNYGSDRYMKVGDTKYYIGDLVIQKVNNYRAEIAYQNKNNKELATAFVANGETGIIKDLCKDFVIVAFDDLEVKYYKSDMNMVGLGYAQSIHKSQGESIDNVIVCTPQSHAFMLNSNLLYVALTRARKNCYHIGSMQTVNNAIHKKENLDRKTFMKDLLLEMYKN